MFVNPEGWFVTAGHVFSLVATISNSLTFVLPGARQKRRKKNQEAITHFTFAFTGTGNCSLTAHVNESADVAVGKIDGVVPPSDYEYPVFRRKDPIAGEMLCRIGFPFAPDDLKARWTADNRFEISDLLRCPLFVNEALVSRIMDLRGDNGSSAGQWIETSSPGLKGQSGGPVADKDGLICGMQVNTEHYPLEFSVRNQYLHVGRAANSGTIRALLDAHGVVHYTR